MDGSFENKGFEKGDVENGGKRAEVAKESDVQLSFKKDGPLKRRTKCEKILLFLLIIVLLVVIILIIVVAVQRKDLNQQKTSTETTTPKPGVTAPAVCLTPDCARASARVYESIDNTIDPCQDFYTFACGRWKKKHAIPEDKVFYGTIAILIDDTEMTNKYLLEDLTSYNDIEAITKARNLYASCMDLQKIEEKKTSPAMQLLDELGGWPVLGSSQGGNWSENDFSFTEMLISLYQYNIKAIVNLGVNADLKDSENYILSMDQPGFGLPGRIYYLDDKLADDREAYVIYASNMAQLFGADKTAADKEMSELLELEIDLARIATSPENRTDVDAVYNKMTLRDIADEIAKSGSTDSVKLDFLEYTRRIFDTEHVKIAINESEQVVVYDMPYFEKVLQVLTKHGKRAVANYGVWMIIKDLALTLDSRFKKLATEYAEAVLGTSSSKPRWKDCLTTTVAVFPKAVGHMFVKETFDESAKTEAVEMIDSIRDAFNELLKDNDWMDDETKKLANEKADAIEEWIGYPDDVLVVEKLNKLYENDTMDRNDYFRNMLTTLKKRATENLQKLRTSVDKNIWEGSPSDVNAYYAPTLNKILFPAGYLQPPVYDKGQPKSMNYGSIGTVMGHEITHGFDDKGRQFDKYGNVNQWWNTSIIENFKEKAKCFVDQYNSYVVPEVGLNVNGILTLGENIADNGGIKQSYKAYRKWVDKRGSEEPMLPGLNFTHNQLFFINFAQAYCENARPGGIIYMINSDVHTPNHQRVTGTLQNSKDFSDAFGCKKNSRMNPEKKCYVW